MDAIQAIKDANVAPNEFWYLSTLILTGILVLFIGVLIFFVKGFFTDLKGTIKDLADNIKTLSELVTIHDVEIKNLKADKSSEKRRR